MSVHNIFQRESCHHPGGIRWTWSNTLQQFRRVLIPLSIRNWISDPSQGRRGVSVCPSARWNLGFFYGNAVTSRITIFRNYNREGLAIAIRAPWRTLPARARARCAASLEVDWKDFALSCPDGKFGVRGLDMALSFSNLNNRQECASRRTYRSNFMEQLSRNSLI